MADEITHIGQFTPDPTNARKHNPRNVGLIEQALNEVGAARSIVIDEAGVVLAGNATIEAAAAAGIERVQVVDADGETIIAVRRRHLTPEQKKRLAIFDNRTAELADWDTEQILAERDEGLDLSTLGFSEHELAELLARPADAVAPDSFKQYDESLETEHQCPRCGYEW
jgi:ParB-like chromosome segregation protein Spo0J